MNVRQAAQRYAAIAALVPVAALLMYARFGRPTSIADQVSDAVAHGRITVAAGARFASLAADMVAGTRFEGRINTADRPRSDRLNAYVIGARAFGASSLACNCAYVGSAIILCDQAFLDSFSTSTRYSTDDPKTHALLSQAEAMNRRWLATWLIGHEIGHAVLHDRDGQYSKQLRRRRAVTLRQEEEADRFFAEHVPRSELNRAGFAVTDFSFQVMSLTYSQSAGRAVVKPSADGIHPPWLLRALHVARTISELERGSGSGESYYGDLERKVAIDPQGVDVGSLCSGEDLRAEAAARYRPRSVP
jgi:hypothetical protein